MTPRHRFHHHAMATSFEVIIAQDGIDGAYAAQAAAAVFQEVDRLEEELSRFRPTSDIWRLGQLQAGSSIQVGMAAWDCLSLAKAVHEDTAGAFDVTIGPLMSLWRAADQSPRQPSEQALLQARTMIGMQLIDLNPDNLTVTVRADQMVLDLGGIGKGYALDQALDVLREWSIERALLNAGDSTLLAVSTPPEEDGWSITLADGEQQMVLRDRALSGSGFAVKGAHIIDPRTFKPVPVRPERRYALAPTAALSDALSTAFMVMSEAEIAEFLKRYPQVEMLALGQGGAEL
jgi:thiamine biosynthesis lipoprotein